MTEMILIDKAKVQQALEFIDSVKVHPSQIAARDALHDTLRTAIEKLETAEFHSAEYWKGHDDAVRGVAMRWEEALTAPIPKAGVMNEPLESLYRRTETLRTAIGQAETAQEQSAPRVEPVAWMCSDESLVHKGYSRFSRNCEGDWNIPVYTTPPQDALVSALYSKIDYLRGKIELLESGLVQAKRTWVGLTDEEIDDIAEFHGLDFMSYAPFTRVIEAKLKEKNSLPQKLGMTDEEFYNDKYA